MGNKPAFVKPQSNVKKNKESHWKSGCDTQQSMLSTDALYCDYKGFARAQGLPLLNLRIPTWYIQWKQIFEGLTDSLSKDNLRRIWQCKHLL